MKRFSLSLLVALFSLTSLFAQYVERATPYSRAKQSVERSRSLQLGDTLHIAPPTREVLRSLMSQDVNSEARTLRFATAIPLDLSPKTAGQWSDAGEGRQSWLLTLSSKGAISLGLRFDRYHLPKGAKLYLYGRNGLVRGAYTEQNNSRSVQGLSLAHLRSDVLTLELNLPKGVSPSEVDLHLSELQYAYYDAFATQGGNDVRASEVFNRQGEPFYNAYGTALDRLRCAPNVVAYPEYSKQARSVVLMVMEGALMGSGVLINNTQNDGTAYVLTAAHNLNRIYSDEIDTREKVQQICNTIVFFFGFESPSRDQNIRGTEELTLSGAELIAYNTDTDMALLKISGLPRNGQGEAYIPDYYNVYYSGWNASLSPKPTFYSIHHALASTKRVSVVADQMLRLKDYNVKEQYWTQKHWHIDRWAVGTTEAGASGSPLYDGDGLIIGALTGGRSTCDDPTTDSYYALAQTWASATAETSLAPWLDPQGSGAKDCQGYDPQQVALTRVSDYYAKATGNLRWQAYQFTDYVSGVGRRIHLSAGVRPLGVFLQLGDSEYIRTTNPHLLIELRPLRDGQVADEVVWKTELSNYNYMSYQSQTGFTEARRTLGYDEAELFVPTDELVDLPQGDYLLSLRSTDDSELNYPILAEYKRITDPSLNLRFWQKTKAGKWSLSQVATQNLWLDLLTLGEVKPEDTSAKRDYPTSSLYTSYYHGGIVYTYNAGSRAEMRIYALDGLLWLKSELAEGESQISIETLPRGRVYLVHIEGDRGKYSYKVLHK